MKIVSITVKSRVKEIPEVQKVLTLYGENIISRLGLHNIGKNKKGLIIVVYEGKNVEEFIENLCKIDGILVQHMEIMDKM